MNINWQHFTFSALSNELLYAILAMRQEVFVVEQTCYYLDADGKDQQSVHVIGLTGNGRIAAYARVLDRGLSYPEYASIGRVLTAPFARGQRLGRPLMQYALRVLREVYGEQPVKLSAQAHLQGFYGSLGYVGVGEVYLEDDIPHRAMVLGG